MGTAHPPSPRAKQREREREKVAIWTQELHLDVPPSCIGGRRRVDLELLLRGSLLVFPSGACTLLKRLARARKFLRNLTAAPPLEGGPPIGRRSILSACGPGGNLKDYQVTTSTATST